MMLTFHPPAWKLVEHVGDLVTLVVPHDESPCPTPTLIADLFHGGTSRRPIVLPRRVSRWNTRPLGPTRSAVERVPYRGIAHGNHHQPAQPEGGSGQDIDLPSPGRHTREGRPARPPDRQRPPGQPLTRL